MCSVFSLLCPLKACGGEVQLVNFDKFKSVLITGSPSYRNLETWFVLEIVVSRSRGRPRVLYKFLCIPKQALSLSACLEIGTAR